MNFRAATLGRACVTTRTALIGCLSVLAGAVSPCQAATPDQAPPVAPSQARVWFLRQLLPGTEMFAPMIYANGAPVANISQGTAFYREFPPGTYLFGVQNCSAAPQSSQTIPLTSGNQVALQIQSDQNGPLDCNPSVIFYINLAPAELLSDLFAPLRYLGQNE
jgi:hypothetical protein